MKRLLRALVSTAAILALCATPGVDASDFYEWTDENGVTHYATSLEEVPEKYRDRVRRPDPRAAGSPATATGKTAPAAPSGEPVPAVEAGDSAAVEPRKFEVPYQASEGSARRVIIPVTFNDRVTVPMALDTGSPGMVVSFGLAARLGLFSADKGTLVVEASGIGGTVPAILTIVDSVSVEGARAVFVPTTVTPSVSDAFEGLVGMDFLASYTCSIDPRRRVVVFSENPPDPDSRGGRDEEWWRSTFAEFRAARDHWREHAESVRGRVGARAQAFVDFQAREAERLLQRLDLHASNHAVPRHWR